MPKRSKGYKENAKLVERANLYETNEAIDLAVKTAKAKFDETVLTTFWRLRSAAKPS